MTTDTVAPMKVHTNIATDLTLHDRCDRCNAAAKGVAEWEWGGTLMFCAHHMRKYEAGLIASGAILLMPDPEVDLVPAI